MSDIAIRVENLSKRYRIGLKEEFHDTFAGALTSFVRSPLKNLKGLRRLSHFEEDGKDLEDVIWALKDVSFEVKRGEVLGIIGRNGAGKSTLLKILSKITFPTTGRVELNGRVASLLEVGTGFHPELTGRENIFLNGTILGMSKKEIDRKFDEIVDFSGVEKFIDTPVKRYSSGMAIRLAFSVAAHLEPETLLVDEVLAVGDAEFQKKCLGKMGDVARGGRTVLFVSHNMGAVATLCGSSLMLEKGSLVKYSESKDTIQEYMNLIEKKGVVSGKENFLQIKNFSVHGKSNDLIHSDDSFLAKFTICLFKTFWNVLVHFTIRDINNSVIVHDRFGSTQIPDLSQKGEFDFRLELPALHLRPGLYSCNVKVVVDDLGGRKRVISDPTMLNVQGSVGSEYDNPAILEPKSNWFVEIVT